MSRTASLNSLGSPASSLSLLDDLFFSSSFPPLTVGGAEVGSSAHAGSSDETASVSAALFFPDLQHALEDHHLDASRQAAASDAAAAAAAASAARALLQVDTETWTGTETETAAAAAAADPQPHRLKYIHWSAVTEAGTQTTPQSSVVDMTGRPPTPTPLHTILVRPPSKRQHSLSSPLGDDDDDLLGTCTTTTTSASSDGGCDFLLKGGSLFVGVRSNSLSSQDDSENEAPLLGANAGSGGDGVGSVTTSPSTSASTPTTSGAVSPLPLASSSSSSSVVAEGLGLSAHSLLHLQRLALLNQRQLDVQSLEQIRKVTHPPRAVISKFSVCSPAAAVAALGFGTRRQSADERFVDITGGVLASPPLPALSTTTAATFVAFKTAVDGAPAPSGAAADADDGQHHHPQQQPQPVKRKRRSPNNGVKQLRLTKWQRENRGVLRACLWELRFFNGAITELSRRYNIPIRTLRRYKQKSTDPAAHPTANDNAAVVFPPPPPGQQVPLPPRQVCDYIRGFTWCAYEGEAASVVPPAQTAAAHAAGVGSASAPAAAAADEHLRKNRRTVGPGTTGK